MRAGWLLTVLSLSAILTTSSLGRADDKEDCASAAEQTQRLRADKKLRAARSQAIQCARAVCPNVIRNDCAKWLREIDGALPTIILRVRDAGDKDLIKVRVTLDGQPFVGELDGTAQPVDTGVHTFRYEADGMEPYEEQILVSQGEKDRVLKVQLKPLATTTSVGHGDGPTVTPDRPVQPTSSHGPGAGPWIVGGVGVAGLLMFGILETTGQLGYSSLRSGCGATAQKCSDDDIAPVRLQLQLAVVGLAVGVVGLGVGITWLLLGSTKASAAAAHVDVTPLPGGGFAGFHTTF